jgi:XTP/dITP diphosphohydrolase
VWPPRGENGFGYDPFFIPWNSKKTFGEMLHKKKILLDHRFEAFKKMAKFHLTDS